MSQQQPQQINVGDLNVQQLADVRRQLEEELNHLTNSFAQLRAAQSKFKACVDSVAEIKPANVGKTILVPLTNSLYAPGKLCDPDNVIVDVGTGYYVQKSRAEATKHYKRKIDDLQSNLDKLQETIQKKQDNLNYVLNLLQAKLQAQTQATTPSASSSS